MLSTWRAEKIWTTFRTFTGNDLSSWKAKLPEIYSERRVIRHLLSTIRIGMVKNFRTTVGSCFHSQSNQLREDLVRDQIRFLSILESSGLGRILLEEVEKRARSDGADLFFTASVCNHPATSFYTRNGYKMVLG